MKDEQSQPRPVDRPLSAKAIRVKAAIVAF
jgi:hypothetical protein